MKTASFFFALILNFSLSAFGQGKEVDLVKLNANLVAYAVSNTGKPVYYQINSGDSGNFSIDLHFGDRIIAHTTFNSDQVGRIENGIAPAGNYVLYIFSLSGKMKFHSVLEDKFSEVAQVNIPLQTSEEETLRIKNVLELLFNIK